MSKFTTMLKNFFNFWKPAPDIPCDKEIAEVGDRYLATYLALGHLRIHHAPFRVRHPLVRLARNRAGILLTPRSGGSSTPYYGVAERVSATGHRYAVVIYDRMTCKYINGGTYDSMDVAGRIATHIVEKLFQVEREVEHGQEN